MLVRKVKLWKIEIGSKEHGLLIGNEALEKLERAKIGVFGIGGVGSFVVEGLVRAGIGNLVMIDPDNISITNLNRQLHAMCSTLGKSKVEVMKQRVLDINPNIKVEVYKGNEIENGEENIIDKSFSYIVDAVDTVTTKIKLISKAKYEDVEIISCMGTGNKLDPSKLEITDIYKTKMCPLAKVVRQELRKRKIDSLKVLYSNEEPIKVKNKEVEGNRIIPGSISFVPSVAGLMIAGEVIRDIISK